MFDPKSAWHGYSGYADGYAMVDPNKLMLLTPGIDRKTGEYLDFGVPATVVANYLREQRIVPEKCDLNSILFLMTPAEDESKLNTLIAKLVKFKNLWDATRRWPRCCRRSARQNAARYAGYTLRKVCNEMHAFYREANVKELQKLCFRAESFPELAMSSEGRLRGARRERSRLRSADAGPRSYRGDARTDLSAGHRRHRSGRALGRRGRKPMLDYFLAFEESFNRFPGFNYEVQGVYQESVDGRIKFHTYVVRE